ncbi:MAG: trigger factor, partial [Cyclobacteriaceae bacterium]
MDITLDKNSATKALIKIKLNESDYQSKFDEKIKEYTKSASIKGFRPGKVPASLIKRMYGKSILAEEINKLLSDSLLDYIKSNDLKIIGDPLPNEDQPSIDWDNQKEFEFEFEVGLTDEFEFDPAVDVTQYEIIVSEKEIDEAFEDLRHQYG